MENLILIIPILAILLFHKSKWCDCDFCREEK